MNKYILLFICLNFVNYCSAFKGFDFTGSYPPDSCLAVSDDKIFAGVNGGFSLFNKENNARLARSNMSTLFNVPGRYFDPRCKFDGSRFVVISALNSQSPSFIAIAISKTSSPQSLTFNDWDAYRIDVNEGQNWCDYPTLEVTNTSIRVTCNMFSAVNRFQNSVLFTFNKNSVNDYTKTNLGGYFTLQPVGENYMVGLLSESSLVLFDGNRPYALSKNRYSISLPDVPQRNSNIQISPGDSRLQNAVQIGKYIYTTHHVNINNRAAAVVYKIDPIERRIVDTTEIESDTEHYFFPCVIDENLVAVNIGSSAENIGFGYYNGESVIELQESSVSAQRSRYGDYSSCAKYQGDYYIHGQLPASREWETVIFNVKDSPDPPPPPPPEDFRKCIEECLVEYPESV